jgi:hypothetical protein
MIASYGERLGVRQGELKFAGQFIHAHRSNLARRAI